MLENLRQNKFLIEKGKKFKIHYFLIESNHTIDSDINVGYISYLYNLNHINQERKNENQQLLMDIEKIRQLEEIVNTNIKSYLLAIKIISLAQKEVAHPVTKLDEISLKPEVCSVFHTT